MSADGMPDWPAALDQWRSTLVDFARVAHTYHAALVREGFSEDQALQLTIAWQTGVQREGSE